MKRGRPCEIDTRVLDMRKSLMRDGSPDPATLRYSHLKNLTTWGEWCRAFGVWKNRSDTEWCLAFMWEVMNASDMQNDHIGELAQLIERMVEEIDHESERMDDLRERLKIKRTLLARYKRKFGCSVRKFDSVADKLANDCVAAFDAGRWEE